MSALSDLFQDIANAIRTKTGSTDSMKPAAFPENILAIEAGGGSGGGSFDGLMFEFGKWGTPNNYAQNWFTHNGSLYVLAQATSGPGDTYNLYKYANGGWTTVTSSGTITGFGNASLWSLIELNGKTHMLGCDSKKHFIFNGSTFTLSSVSVPNYISEDATFVQDGKLKAYSYYTGTVYVWDESTDSWTAEAVVGSKYSYYYFINDGNDVYSVYSGKVYRYADGALTQVAATSAGASDSFVVYNSELYYHTRVFRSAEAKNSCEWYKVDTETGGETFCGYGPYVSSNSQFFVWNGEPILIFWFPSNSSAQAAVVHGLS